jgi:hypothetical protein
MKPMSTKKLRTLLSVAGLAIAACGGGETGTISLKLTDAPPDVDNMAAAIVTIARVDVHVAGGHDGKDGDDDGEKSRDAGPKKENGKVVRAEVEGGDADDRGGWRTLVPAPEMAPYQYDLLKLQNGVTAGLGELPLPPGKITQIRLHIDPAGTNEIRLKDGQVCKLDLSRVDRTGVKINHPFKALEVVEGQRTEAVVDFDVRESVSKEGECDYRLTPVVKLKSAKIE